MSNLFKIAIAAAILTVSSSPLHAQVQAQAQARNVELEETNRQIVLKFYDRFFNQHRTGEAGEVISDEYIQHNPMLPDGKAPFIGYFAGFFAENPGYSARIVRSATDGDLVWVHVESRNGSDDRAEAVVDIFRVQDGMIVEHWDVIQDVPAEAANTNTMF